VVVAFPILYIIQSTRRRRVPSLWNDWNDSLAMHAVREKYRKNQSQLDHKGLTTPFHIERNSLK
jgi:hypothetical protein